jgi:hypothetical protein
MQDRSNWSIHRYVDELAYLLEIQEIPEIKQQIEDLQIEVFHRFTIEDLESVGVSVRVEYLH